LPERRLALGAAALLPLSLAVLPTAAAGEDPPNKEDASRQEQALKKLNGIPLFLVSNNKDEGYLTEFDAKTSKRYGLVFFEPKAALAKLQEIQAFDPKAQLRILPSDQVYPTVSKTVADIARAEQPKAGASSDLRLFVLRPIEAELQNASGSKDKLAENSVPLFYEPTLRIALAKTDKGDTPKSRPYFFRLGDLDKVYDAQKEAGQEGLAEKPTLGVTTLDAVLTGLELGEVEMQSLIVAASDATSVVQNSGGRLDEVFKEDRDDNVFFLDVPFANGYLIPQCSTPSEDCVGAPFNLKVRIRNWLEENWPLPLPEALTQR